MASREPVLLVLFSTYTCSCFPLFAVSSLDACPITDVDQFSASQHPSPDSGDLAFSNNRLADGFFVSDGD